MNDQMMVAKDVHEPFCMEDMNADNLAGYDYAVKEHIAFINDLLDHPDRRGSGYQPHVQKLCERIWNLVDRNNSDDTKRLDALEDYVRTVGGLRLFHTNYNSRCPGLDLDLSDGTVRSAIDKDLREPDANASSPIADTSMSAYTRLMFAAILKKSGPVSITHQDMDTANALDLCAEYDPIGQVMHYWVDNGRH